MRARVVERQIVRHLTHLIPYLTPSPVTTLIHPFLGYQLSSNQTLSPYTPTSLSLFLFLFTPQAASGPPLHRPPLPPPVPPPAPPSPLLYALSLDGPRRATASKALDYLPLISARVAHLLPRLPRLPRPKDQPPSPTASNTALPFSLRFPPFVPPFFLSFLRSFHLSILPSLVTFDAPRP